MYHADNETFHFHFVVPLGHNPGYYSRDPHDDCLWFVFRAAKALAHDETFVVDADGPWISATSLAEWIDDHEDDEPTPEGIFDEDGYPLEEWLCRLAERGDLIVRKTSATRTIVTNAEKALVG